MTATLTRRVVVRSSQRAADAGLDRVTPDQPGASLQLLLSPSVRLDQLGTDIGLESPVVAELRRSASGISVHWRPGNRRDTFPRFTGRLWSQPDTLCRCWLCVEGLYRISNTSNRLAQGGEPSIGSRFAQALAKELLDEIVRAIGA